MVINDDATFLFLIGHTNIFSADLLYEVFYAKINISMQKIEMLKMQGAS